MGEGKDAGGDAVEEPAVPSGIRDGGWGMGDGGLGLGV